MPTICAYLEYPRKIGGTPYTSSEDEVQKLGHGYYDEHSHEQGAANTFELPLLKDAANSWIGIIPRALRIAEYGSAQAHNSLPPIRMTISQLNSRFPQSKLARPPILGQSAYFLPSGANWDDDTGLHG